MTETQAFPCLPQWFTAGKAGCIPARMRPFGSAQQDLDVTFALAERPALITEILALCCHGSDGAPVNRSLLLQMPVSMRIEVLLSLASLNDSSPFTWRVHCNSPQCVDDREQNEFALTLDQILAVANDTREAETEVIPLGQTEATLRRPTAADQMQWLRRHCVTDPAALLRSVVVRPALETLLEDAPVESLACAVDDAMESFDPLLGFHVKVVCPRCGNIKDVSPDLTGEALGRLCAAQRKAIEDVHLLAREYHWSEAEILGLPARRRQTYLDLVRAEAHRK